MILGGRGMGKSVLLRQIQAAAAAFPETRVDLFAAPPAELTAEDCLEALSRSLGVEAGGALGALEILNQYRARHPQGSLILLFDEFDRYAQSAAVPASRSAGRQFFNNLETARRELPWVGIAAAGSIGVFVFRDVLGSSFLARAEQFRLASFGRAEIAELARPFAEAGRALGEDALDALFLASGGIPALVTFGLQELWDDRAGRPAADLIPEIFSSFRERHREFLRDIEQSFSDPSLSEAPQRVRELVLERGGPVPRADLERVCQSAESTLKLDVLDVLHLLSVSGLIRLEGSPANDDPVAVWPVISIVSLPQASSAGSDLRERFLNDLKELLGWIHAGSADFFRPADRDSEERLVHEKEFSGALFVAFRAKGWQVDREAQQGAGRTDLKLRRNGGRETVIVEVKIWGRNDFQEVHQQIESYWATETVAGAVVMLTDREIQDWPATYRSKCIPPGVLPTAIPADNSPIQAQLRYSSLTPDGLRLQLDHFLLRLRRRH